MALETIAIGLIQRDFMDIATDVQTEFKAEVKRSLKHPSQSTGQAAGSIAIRQESADRILVGSEDQHLNFLIRGNGSKIIYPKGKGNGGANALKYRDGSIHGRSTPYKGKPEILTRVADKFR